MIEIRLATDDDVDAIVDLFHAIDVHYYGEDAPSRAAIDQHVRGSVLGPRSGVDIVLALRAGSPVGIATFSVLYPAPENRGQLFMKDLFTTADARGDGVGEQIMRFLAAHALDLGCGRFDWTAETSNPRALAFYDRLGADVVSEKVYFRISGDALERFGEGEPI
ncbi:MAG: GNAT family N-acetyltransferase [Actinomycetota bacterium]